MKIFIPEIITNWRPIHINISFSIVTAIDIPFNIVAITDISFSVVIAFDKTNPTGVIKFKWSCELKQSLS